MRPALPWLLVWMTGCATAANAPSLAPERNTPTPALAANSSSDSGLREKLDQAEAAVVDCVLRQAVRLAEPSQSLDQIALAAMVACSRQERALRDVTELAYGRERSLAHMHIIEEQMRRSVFAVVATLRLRARKAEPSRSSARHGTDI